MPRLIVAPVGHQPAGVLGPLQNPELGPAADDGVLLVCSAATRASARIVERMLRDRMVSRIDVREIAGHRLPQSLCQEFVRSTADSDRVDLLVNGGPTGWVFDFLQLSSEVADRSVGVWASRDRHLLRLRLGDGTETWTEVPSLGTDTLLSTLGLTFVGARLESTSGSDVLEGVLELAERAGLLYAVLDARDWDKGTYRRFILDHERLQRLGLDQRRIALAGTRFAGFERRTLQDGIVTLHTDGARCAWIEDILRREPTGPAGGNRGLPKATAPVGSASPPWEGTPLLLAMGTQAGTTLQAIWAHRPRELHVAYDPEAPESARLAILLLSDGSLGSRDVSLVPERHDHPFRPGIETSSGLAVNLTPGDKISTLRMWIYGRSAGARFWLLEGNRAAPADSGDHLPARSIPVRTWLRFNAPGEVEMSRADDDQVHVLASQVVPWLASAAVQDLWSLGDLSRRGRRPLRLYRQQRELKLPDGSRFGLDQLPAIVRDDFLNPQGGGLWFEWVAASWLSRTCQLDDVAARVRVAWPGTPVTRAFRDDLDIVSQSDGQWALWSCKTRGPLDPTMATRGDLDEGLAQSNRVLGRHRLAILLVPRLAPRVPAWVRVEAIDGAKAWRASDRQWVVDCAFLANTEAVRKLAGLYALRA